jgi:hypothetical protein
MRKDIVCNDPAFGQYYQFAYVPYITDVISRQWVVDDHYHRKLASGQHLEPFAYKKERVTVKAPYGYIAHRYCHAPCGPPPDSTPIGQELKGVQPGIESTLPEPTPFVPDTLTDVEMRRRGVNKAILNAKNDLSLLLSDYYQRVQAEKMIANTVRRLAHAVKALRRGDLGGVARLLGQPSTRKRLTGRTVSQQWLEIQYGWKPLLSDVYDVFEALTPIQGLIRSIGRSHCDIPLSGVQEDPTFTSTNEIHISKKSKTTLYFTFPGDGALLQAAQGGLFAPLEVAWDLLPWSFLIDWFLPIGDYFQALNASVSLDFLDGSTTIKHKSLYRRRKDLHVPGCAGSSGYYTWSTEMFRLQRFVESNALYTFGAKNPFSFTHLANALALLRSAFK